jgi:para-nitrobenzyl esterase
VGVFGFFAHPELTTESGRNASGNYGLMDQLAAIRWVQRNISAFGGDPNNISIAGQSAGSMSVNCLVASPLSKNLFQKAIGESGATMVSDPSRRVATLQKAEQEGIKIAQSLNANSIAELRKMPAAELFQKAKGSWLPIVDGYVLPDAVSNIYAAHKENHISLLTGWNQDEGFLFGPLKNAESFRKEANEKYAADAKTFLEFYPAATDSEAAISQLYLSRDMIFGVQNYVWANNQSEDQCKVYVYRFTRKLPATGKYAKYGAFHTGEVPYAYNNLKFVNRPWQPVDVELSHTMSSYWANFAKTGNPNGKGLPEWPAYEPKEKKIMVLSENPIARRLPDFAALDFLYARMNPR